VVNPLNTLTKKNKIPTAPKKHRIDTRIPPALPPRKNSVKPEGIVELKKLVNIIGINPNKPQDIKICSIMIRIFS
jgi:hypothetical protein